MQVHLEDSQLSTSLYRKPTDTLQYLHFDSCHPSSHKLPIAYSQALRIHKICSRRSSAMQHCQELKSALIARGYPRGPVQRQIEKALKLDRDTLIFPVHSAANRPATVIPMVIPFHPDIAHIPDILRTHLPLLGGSDIVPKVYWKPPKKVRNLLVSSFLRTSVDRPIAQTHSAVGMVPCLRPRCKTCKNVDTASSITSTTTNLSYKVASATCSSKHVIYMLKFTNCDKMYIGQTEQQFSLRMNGHRSSVNKRDVQLPFSHHFIEHEHSWDDVQLTILESVPENKTLDSSESHWISQLMSDHPFGLNIQNVLYRNCFKMSDL